jgi:hypothetical protein
VANWDVASATRKEWQAALQALQESLWGKDGGAGRSEFDCQRQPIEMMTDRADSPDVGVGTDTPWSDSVRPLAEETNGVVPAQVDGRRLLRRERQGLDGEDVLATNAERLTTRHEHLEPVTTPQERDKDERACQNLLEVVDDEEEVPVP